MSAVQSSFDRLYHRFPRRAYAHPLVPQFANNLREGSSVLILGSGDGFNAVFLACRGYRVTCVDFSANALTLTQRLATQEGVRLDALHQADLNDPDVHTLLDGPYGGILCINVLEFLSEDSAARNLNYLASNVESGGSVGIVSLLEGRPGEREMKMRNGMYRFDVGEVKSHFSGWKPYMELEYCEGRRTRYTRICPVIFHARAP